MSDAKWCWANFGAHLMLVTVSGGSKVVLCSGGPYALQTRCPETGVLRVLCENDDVAALIAAAPELYEALRRVHALVSEAALTGFNPLSGDWAERLYSSQQETSAALAKAVPPGPSVPPQET